MCFSGQRSAGVYMGIPRDRSGFQPQPEPNPQPSAPAISRPHNPPIAPEPTPDPVTRRGVDIASFFQKAGGLIGASGAGGSAPPMKGAGTGRVIR